jgi:hypothetical protein
MQESSTPDVGVVVPPTEERKIPALSLLGFFIHEYPEYVEEIPMIVFDSTRKKSLGGKWGWQEKPATLTMITPDDVVLNMRGDEDKRDWYLMVRVSREAMQQLQEKQESRIITPDTALVG